MDELERMVDAGEIAALTLDTTVFDQFGCNLSYRLLTSLEQFRGTDVTPILSDVVIAEVRAHIAASVAEAAEKARAGVNQYVKAWRGGDDLQALLGGIGVARDPKARAAELVDAYVERVRAERVPVEPGASVAELAARYFDERPPFSAKAKKKSEFPDAIALLTLDAWAARRGTRVLAVSKDGDWARYAAESENLIVLPELAAALALFNRESSVAAARIVATIRSGGGVALRAAIQRNVEALVEDYEVLANAPYFYEEENEASQVLGWAFADEHGFDVVAADDETVSLAGEIELNAEFTTRFSFSRRDPIDRDYIEFGSTRATVTETFRMPVVATFSKEAQDDPEPLGVEVEAGTLSVDFDYVEPDWGEEAD